MTIENLIKKVEEMLERDFRFDHANNATIQNVRIAVINLVKFWQDKEPYSTPKEIGIHVELRGDSTLNVRIWDPKDPKHKKQN